MNPLDQVEVDGKWRPSCNSKGQLIHPDEDGIRNFWRWFNESKVVDTFGRPIVVYHGTSNLENMNAFNPDLTGGGNDQIGSGFYFTTDPVEASGYTSASTPTTDHQKKLGSGDHPGVVAVYLSIRSPIQVNGATLNDTAIDVTQKQAEYIISRAPDIRDINNSPIGNWIDIWSAGKVTDAMISKVARSYLGASLISLENDFYRSNSHAFRETVNQVLPHDGVTQRFEDGKTHWVAWFPNQIKSAIGNSGRFDANNPDISDRQPPSARKRAQP